MHKIFNRVKDIVLKPKETWNTISTEETSVAKLGREYLLILAAVPSLASFLGNWIIGIRIPFVGFYRLTFGESLINSIVIYILIVAEIWAVGKLISLLAKNFSSNRDDIRGFKVAVYIFTPYLASGVFNLIPYFSPLMLIAGLYGLYLLYIGLPVVMETPKEKSLPYFVVILTAIVLIFIIVSMISGAILKAFGPSLPRI